MVLHKNIRLLGLHNFFSDFVLFAPVAILYFQQVTGSYALGMSIFSISYVSSALFEVPTGVVSDYFGRRKTLILGSVATVLCVVLYAVGISFWVLVAGSLLHGLSLALYSGNNDALLHESLAESHQEHEYQVYLGKTSAMFQVGLAIAAILGSVIAHWSFVWVMWISVLPQLGAFITSLYIQEPTRAIRSETNIYLHMREALSGFRANTFLRTLSLASIFRFSLGETAYFLRSAFFATLWPVWAIGFGGFIAHAGAATTYYLSGNILRRFKPLSVLFYELFVNRSLSFIALLFPGILSPVLLSFTSWLFGVGSIAINALMQKEFTQKQRATMSSLNAFAGSIAFGIFSVILGMITDHWGIWIAMMTNHILLLVLPLLFYRKLSKHIPRYL